MAGSRTLHRCNFADTLSQAIGRYSELNFIGFPPLARYHDENPVPPSGVFCFRVSAPEIAHDLTPPTRQGQDITIFGSDPRPASWRRANSTATDSGSSEPNYETSWECDCSE